MTDVSFADLVVRMVVSLGIVLGIVLGAYALIRRRQGFGSGSRSHRPSLLSRVGSRPAKTPNGGGRSSKMPGSRRGLRVVGRVGIGRTTQVVAVQFAEKVYLLGASETNAPTILAELAYDAWLDATEHPDDLGTGTGSVRSAARSSAPTSASTGAKGSGPTNLLDALREATLRRG